MYYFGEGFYYEKAELHYKVALSHNGPVWLPETLVL